MRFPAHEVVHSEPSFCGNAYRELLRRPPRLRSSSQVGNRFTNSRYRALLHSDSIA